jgi:hypothetical protein
VDILRSQIDDIKNLCTQTATNPVNKAPAATVLHSLITNLNNTNNDPSSKLIRDKGLKPDSKDPLITSLLTK